MSQLWRILQQKLNSDSARAGRAMEYHQQQQQMLYMCVVCMCVVCMCVVCMCVDVCACWSRISACACWVISTCACVVRLCVVNVCLST